MASDRRGLVVPLLLLAYLFLQPDPVRPVTRSDGRLLIDDSIAEEQYHLSAIQNSTWSPSFGKFGTTLNVTGLQPERGFAWDFLPDVKARAEQQLEYALGAWGVGTLNGEAVEGDPAPLYANVTGHVQGSWRRSSLEGTIPTPQLNLTEYVPLGPFGQRNRAQTFDRNITGPGGHVSIRMEQQNLTGAGISTHSTSEITADLTFEDGSSFSEYEVKMHGVYFTTLGQAVLTTTSRKFAGIFALPHLALSQHMFESARAVLNASISSTIKRQIDRKNDALNPWGSTLAGDVDSPFSLPDCDLIVYLQQMVPRSEPEPNAAVLAFMEHELRFPTGASLPKVPDMHFSMLAFSPDCGYVLESKGPPEDFAQEGDHLTGPKRAVLFHLSRNHLLVYTTVLGLQLVLLIRQMRETNTPSTRSRISFYTIAMFALGDGFATMTFMLISFFILGLWVNLAVTGFLAFINVSFFGMRFLMDIWQVQAPERERRARAEVEEERRREEAFQATMQRLRNEMEARRRENAASDGIQSETRGVSVTGEQMHPVNESPNPGVERPDPPPALPTRTRTPVPIDTGATPVFMPSDQAGLEAVGEPILPITQMDTTAAVQARMPTFASLYVRFYLLLLGATFLSLHATSWPAVAQRVYFTLLALVYLSFWLPQIYRNVQRNCRRAFQWEFILGQSILRLTPFFYFYGYSNNVLFTTPDYYGLGILAIWVWIQLVVLISQELIGPRWFIRRDWAPPAYDYHPVLREDEEGATMPIGFSQAQASSTAPSSPTQERSNPATTPSRRGSSAKESKAKGKRIFDCAICMQDLEVPVIESGTSASDASLTGGLLARRGYMLAPCRHIFHSACLEGWMKYRLQCPICRETLPPL